MKTTTRLALGAAIAVMMLAGAPSAAFAQQDPTNQNIPSLEFQAADVREALRSLFKSVGVSYTIDPTVQGPVTVSLRNVTFEVALQNITRQVDATYRIEGGVYQIVKRDEPGQVGPGETTTQGPIPNNKVRRRIKIRVADPQFIAILMGAETGSQQFGLAPEISTVQNTKPVGGGGGGLGGGGLGGGGGGLGGGGGGLGGGGLGGGGGGLGGGGLGGGGGGGGFGR